MRGAAGPASPADSRTRTVFCRNCKRTVEVPAANPEGRPYGWFYLTVQVPPWFNANNSRKPYRAVGFFCSAACLGAAMPEIEAQESLMKEAYEHE
jgi:hypothetical protein